jgi:Protein of unknown function (DUF1573)
MKLSFFHLSLYLSIPLSLCLSFPAYADNWAEGLFEQRSKDFGTVPRGPVLTHSFRITNRTGVAVQADSLRVSCGCVVARMEQPSLAPGQCAEVTAEMHTDRFLGDKTVSVYVHFNLPMPQEVALQVKARSCEDVSVTPDTLDFGRGVHGQPRKAQAIVSLPGMEQYQIQKVTADSDHVHVAVTEMPTNGVNKLYQLTATLDSELGVGKWYTEVWLHTNHPWMERIRVPVSAEVEQALVVSPANMMLEVPAPGQKVQRKVLVHGNAPFAILVVKGTDAQWSVHDDTPGRSSRHVLTVTLESQSDGALERCFQVVTDLPDDNTVQFHAQAQK